MSLVSLEKKMYILPNRFFIMNNKLFVSFNLSNIPRDMTVTSVEFHLPLINLKSTTNIHIKEIISRWNEKELKSGKLPIFSKERRILKARPNQKELIADMTLLGKRWYLSHKMNHGIFVMVEKKNMKYLEKNPPFLIIDTI